MTGDFSGAAAEPPDGLPAGLLTAWRVAEERLYPMVMVRPERYEQVVRLVGRAAVELQLTCPDLESLVAAAPDVADILRRLSAAGGDPIGPADELDLPLMAGAACALRYRQLAADLGRRQRLARIASAGAAGEEWVTVDQGQPPTSWPPLPSTTLELHLPTGRALAGTIEVDPGSGERTFRLAEVRLDPATGDLVASESSGFCKDYDKEEVWRAAIDEHRGLIEQGH